MILRRIAEGIKNQDWFVVLIEIFIVVIGIYIGLQVDDWNKASQDRVDEQKFLQALLDETQHNLEQVRARNRSLENDIAAMRRVVAGLKASSPASISEEDSYQAICDWHTIIPPSYQTTTYDELVSTGQLKIISNDTLRRQLQASEALRSRFDLERVTFWDIHHDLARDISPFILWDFDDRYFEKIGCNIDLEGLATRPDVISSIVELVGLHVVLISFYSRELEALMEIEKSLLQGIGGGAS